MVRESCEDVVMHGHLILASFHKWIDKSHKRASSREVILNFDEGFGKFPMLYVQQTNPESSIQNAIKDCLITFLLSKGLEHPISAGISFHHRKENSHYHSAVSP